MAGEVNGSRVEAQEEKRQLAEEVLLASTDAGGRESTSNLVLPDEIQHQPVPYLRTFPEAGVAGLGQ
jgi:hypothetical protein